MSSCTTYIGQVNTLANAALDAYHVVITASNKQIMINFAAEVSVVNEAFNRLRKIDPFIESQLLTPSQEEAFSCTISGLLQKDTIEKLMQGCENILTTQSDKAVHEIQSGAKTLLVYQNYVLLISTAATNFYNTVTAISGLIGKNPVCFTSTITLSEIRLLETPPQNLLAPNIQPLITLLTTLAT